MIGILVAEHLPLVRLGLVTSLGGEADLKVVADLGDGEDVVSAALRHGPDAAIIGLDLPGSDGFSTALRLHERAPGCRVLILSRRPTPGQVRRAFAVHALGFVSLETGPEEIAESVRRVAAGHRAVDSDLAVAALESVENPLTRRELDVLRQAAQGARSGEIAEELFLSVGTVRNHLSRIMCKTGARNRLDAVRIASDAGWL
ncbi:response regulator transcription factor [Planomonospora venezuelensis]|uniref:Two-component system response regulator DesR n=1 Tax=Planomonospora venezuelensis TaxID=1999 RepID=A0A841D2K2_PLAVE|nr:response regulator transcription factor [Planomonospora venezuelensis]MBB5962628.1 two-component system response regulator DesR [Planomonospora venezuelensis]GIM98378.1 DNA-binding response regulator [Planomonospora venezuelensis]